MDERTTIYNDDFSMDYGNLEDDNNVNNEESSVYTDNLEYN
jgi:hypothetical protein